MKNFRLTILFFIFLLGLIIRIYDLDLRSAFYPDETVYINVASYYAFGITEPIYSQFDGEKVYLNFPNHVNYEHPILAKILIGFSQIIFGLNLEGSRMLSAILGSLSVLIAYLIFRIFLPINLALIFTFIFSFEPLNVSISRSAMLDTFSFFFSILALFFYFKFKDFKFKILFSSIFVALAFASKWTSFPLIISLFLLITFSKKNLFFKFYTVFVFITLIFSIYVISYIPYFIWLKETNYILPIEYRYLDYGSHTIFDFFKLQFWMINYNLIWHLGQDSPYDLLIFNPWLYIINFNSFQMFTANPLITYSGIIMLAVFTYYIFLNRIKKYYEIICWFLPLSLLLFIKGLSWYLIFFNFVSLLILGIINNFISKDKLYFYFMFLSLIIFVNFFINFYNFYFTIK